MDAEFVAKYALHPRNSFCGRVLGEATKEELIAMVGYLLSEQRRLLDYMEEHAVRLGVG